MALKKPSDLFNQKNNSGVFDTSKLSLDITESYDKFRDNFEKVNQLSEKIDSLSKELSEKLTRTDLENAMISQLMILDENFKNIQNQIKGLNKKDLKEFKETVYDLGNIVSNLVNEEIPKYKKHITSNEVRLSNQFEDFKNEIQQRVQDFYQVLNEFNDVVQVIDNVSTIEEYLQEHHQELIELREEVFEEIEKLPVGNLQENIQRLEKKIDYIRDTYSSIDSESVAREIIQEGLLNEPPETKSGDSLTPLNQNFVTIDQLQEHYRLFINRIQQQLATLGGGGETQLKYLDDVIGIATDPSSYDGKFLKYDHSIGKFIFETVSGGGGTQDLNTTLGYGNTSSLGMSVGVVTATRAVFTANTTVGNPAVQIVGLVTSSETNHGLLEVGELNFTDSNIISSFSDEVNSYTQFIIQNKSDGEFASSDIVVNNDRPSGDINYGNFGINSSGFGTDDAFSDPNGTYLYSTGGTLTIGTLNNYDFKLVANNLVMLRFDGSTAVPYFGVEESTINLANPLAVFTYNSPQYTQLQIQNKSSGSEASVDFIASTDTATDVSEYIDMGINNSGFSTNGLWGPKDGYLYVHGPTSGSGGNLVIGTIDGDVNRSIIFHTSGIGTSNERLRITNEGVGIGTTNPTSKLDVRGDIRVGVNTSQGLILTSPNGTQFRLVVDNSGNLSTVMIP